MVSLNQDDPLEEEMATHPSILAWRLLWTGQESLEGYSMEGHKEAPISRSALEMNPMPGHLFEGNPVGEDTK